MVKNYPSKEVNCRSVILTYIAYTECNIMTVKLHDSDYNIF